MLSQQEKAYYLALKSVAARKYDSAVVYFEQASDSFQDNAEFRLIRETTRLLVAVRLEIAQLEHGGSDQTEAITSGIVADASDLEGL